MVFDRHRSNILLFCKVFPELKVERIMHAHSKAPKYLVIGSKSECGCYHLMVADN